MNESNENRGGRIAARGCSTLGRAIRRKWLVGTGAIACAVVAAAVMLRPSVPIDDEKSPPDNVTLAEGESLFAKLPLHFEPSQSGNAYVARGRGYALDLDSDGATLNLARGGSQATLDLMLVDSQPARLRGEQKLEGVSNYFLGSDSSQWRANVPHFSRVRYDGVYPGIDLVYYGAGRDLEYDFIVAPGVDPAQIKLNYAGAQNVRVDDEGNLRIAVGDGEVVHRRPIVYQTLANGVRASVAGAFRIARNVADVASAIVSFDIGQYDTRLPLVIDPVLTYSSYLGSTDEDDIIAIAVDGSGAVYVAGDTESANFPVTAGAAQTAHGSPGGSDSDVFIAKLNAQGTALEYSTFLGGNDSDFAADIKIDAAGSAYVAGRTISTNFPTVSAFDSTFGGGNGADIFVAHLNAQGTTLLYSTYLGGARADGSSSSGSEMALRIDGSGSAWILSTSQSNDYPVTAGAPQTARSGDPTLFADDWVITKLSANGASLAFSTYFGGAGSEALGNSYTHERARASFYVTDSGLVTFVGTTSNVGIPATAGVVQATPGGSTDLAIVRMNTATNSLVFATHLGGSGFERLGGSALDASGNIYVCGETQGPNFPTTAGAFDTRPADRDIFVAKLNPTVTALTYSTLLGGSGADFDPMCRVDAAGSVFVAGSTVSTDFPVTAGAFDTTSDFDSGFIAKVNPTGSALAYASYLSENVEFLEINSNGEAYVAFVTPNDELLVTPGGRAFADNEDAYFMRLNAAGSAGLDASYIGGGEDEIIAAVALASSGDLYIAGSTESDNFATTPGAVQTSSGNPGSLTDADAFIVRMAMGDGSSPPPPPPPPQPGVVQFSAAASTINENGGSVTLTLTRTNGADGGISVSVASGGGSAVAGSDYTALLQTVNWATGDSAAKTVSFAVTSDTADEPDETVIVTLSNPSGGATLGTVSSSTVTILDDDVAVSPPPPAPPAPTPPSPTPNQASNAKGSYGGGGSMDWMAFLGLLALGLLARRNRGAPWARASLRRFACACTAVLVSLSAARAEETAGWYLGMRGGIGDSTLDEHDVQRALAARGHSVEVQLDDEHETWSVFGGHRFRNGLGIEAGLIDLGEYDLTVSGTTTNPPAMLQDAARAMADAGKGVSVTVGWTFDLGPDVAVTPRVGGYYWESEREVGSSAGMIRVDEDGFDLTGGLSVDLRITPAWSLGFAYDIWDAGDHNDIRTYSAALQYRFGP